MRRREEVETDHEKGPGRKGGSTQHSTKSVWRGISHANKDSEPDLAIKHLKEKTFWNVYLQGMMNEHAAMAYKSRPHLLFSVET